MQRTPVDAIQGLGALSMYTGAGPRVDDLALHCNRLQDERHRDPAVVREVTPPKHVLRGGNVAISS